MMEYFRNKKVLVIGSSGFVGTNLCHALVKASAILTRFSRTQRYEDGLEDTQWYAGEFSDRSAIARAVEGQEIVFHCISGSVPGTSNLDIKADLDFNVGNTIGLLDICRQAQIKKFVFMSSGGTVYGEHLVNLIKEDHPTTPVSAYGVTKLTIEKYLSLYKHLFGLDFRVVRLSNPFGRFQRAYRKQGLIATLIEKHLRGIIPEIWGDGEVVRDYVYIDDAVEAILQVTALESDYSTFNVGSGKGRTVNQVITSLEEVLGEKIERVYLRDRSVDVAHNVLDVSLLQQLSSWRPMSDWEQSLTMTVDWLKAELSGESGSRS